jgi:hypothetical protein
MSLIAAAGIFAAALPLRAGESAGLPPPGSYTLDHIQRVPAGIVLEGTKIPRALCASLPRASSKECDMSMDDIQPSSVFLLSCRLEIARLFRD